MTFHLTSEQNQKDHSTPTWMALTALSPCLSLSTSQTHGRPKLGLPSSAHGPALEAVPPAQQGSSGAGLQLPQPCPAADPTELGPQPTLSPPCTQKDAWCSGLTPSLPCSWQGLEQAVSVSSRPHRHLWKAPVLHPLREQPGCMAPLGTCAKISLLIHCYLL